MHLQVAVATTEWKPRNLTGIHWKYDEDDNHRCPHQFGRVSVSGPILGTGSQTMAKEELSVLTAATASERDSQIT